MATLDPIILIDTREQRPLAFPGWRTARTGLWAGDYSMRGFANDEVLDWPAQYAITVERKSIPDLYGTLMQGRKTFVKEVHKFRWYRWKGLVIEGTPADLWEYVETNRRQGDPSSIMSSLRSFEVNHDLHVSWAVDPEGAAMTIMEWFRLYANARFHRARKVQNLLTIPPAVGVSMDDDEAREIAEAAAQASGATGTGRNTNENTGE